MKRTPKPRHRVSHENKLTWLTFGAVVPGIIVSLLLLWFDVWDLTFQWTPLIKTCLTLVKFRQE